MKETLRDFVNVQRNLRLQLKHISFHYKSCNHRQISFIPWGKNPDIRSWNAFRGNITDENIMFSCRWTFLCCISNSKLPIRSLGESLLLLCRKIRALFTTQHHQHFFTSLPEQQHNLANQHNLILIFKNDSWMGRCVVLVGALILPPQIVQLISFAVTTIVALFDVMKWIKINPCEPPLWKETQVRSQSP